MEAIATGRLIGLLIAVGTSVMLTWTGPPDDERQRRYHLKVVITIIRGALAFAISGCVLVVGTFLAINLIEHHRETFPIEGAYETLNVIQWSSLVLSTVLAGYFRNRVRRN